MPTVHVQATLVGTDGTSVTHKAVEFFSRHEMIWIRHRSIPENGLKEVVIQNQRYQVEHVENKYVENGDQLCKIKLVKETSENSNYF